MRQKDIEKQKLYIGRVGIIHRRCLHFCSKRAESNFAIDFLDCTDTYQHKEMINLVIYTWLVEYCKLSVHQ